MLFMRDFHVFGDTRQCRRSPAWSAHRTAVRSKSSSRLDRSSHTAATELCIRTAEVPAALLEDSGKVAVRLGQLQSGPEVMVPAGRAPDPAQLLQ